MSVSGVEVPEEVKAIVKGLKTGGLYLYAVFHLMDSSAGSASKYVWECKATQPKIEATKNNKQIDKEEFRVFYDQFVRDHLSSCEEPVYALFDLSGVRDLRMNIVGFQWCPDTCTVKKKMVYASSLSPLKRLAGESTRVIETNDADDVEFDMVVKMK